MHKVIHLIPRRLEDRLGLVGTIFVHEAPIEVRHTRFLDTYDVRVGVLTGPGRVEIVVGRVEVCFVRFD